MAEVVSHTLRLFLPCISVFHLNVIFTVLMGRYRYEEMKYLTQPRSCSKSELRADSRPLDFHCVLQSTALQVS